MRLHASVAAVSFDPLPHSAAWRHRDAREGFEVVFFGGHRLAGHTSAVETGEAWAVEYAIEVDAGWITQRARIRSRSRAGSREVKLEHDGRGGWTVDGVPAPQLAGCLDVDLEASALTNALPVHRLDLSVGSEAKAPAVYVRALDAAVERLEQSYRREPDGREGARFAYAAPAFDVRCELRYDRHGLVLDYPGIAERCM
jgi:uncharacterized protein